MNYLAHAFLSGNQEALLIGNFIADHVRGNNFEGYTNGIIEGIKLHRRIDSFTDAHPDFKKTKRLFYDGFQKHSGILIDIYFDHVLAKNFNRYSTLGLNDFSKNAYAVYLHNQHMLPETSNRFLGYVIKNNIYESYSYLAGIEKVLYHLSQRIQHNVQLQESVKVFEANSQAVEDLFFSFFSDVLQEFKPSVV